MLSAELGMVVSRPCWLFLRWSCNCFLSGSCFRVLIVFGWIAFADKSAQLGNVVEALGGFILVRGWCPYRRVPAGRRLLVRHGGGVLDFF